MEILEGTKQRPKDLDLGGSPKKYLVLTEKATSQKKVPPQYKEFLICILVTHYYIQKQ